MERNRMNHGGHRDGAGRKASALRKFMRVFRATDAEAAIIDGMTPEQRTEACVAWSKANKNKEKAPE